MTEQETARARIAELEAEVGNTEWFWTIVDKDGLTGLPSIETEALRMLADRAARADRLATELAEAKAAGREAGLREALRLAEDKEVYGAWQVIDAIHARLSAAEPTADEKG